MAENRDVSRRDALKLLGGAGLLTASGGVPLTLSSASAQTTGSVPNGAGFNRLKVGDFRYWTNIKYFIRMRNDIIHLKTTTEILDFKSYEEMYIKL